LLFGIGLKGGAFLGTLQQPKFYMLGLILLIIGFLQPFFSFSLLKRFANLDKQTAAVVAASFGSVSVMTYLAGTFFLDKMGVSYDSSTAVILALMELPAIFAALIMSRYDDHSEPVAIHKALMHPSIALIVLGLFISYLAKACGFYSLVESLLVLFKPLLAIFLFMLGANVANEAKDLKSLNPFLMGFAIISPLFGAMLGVSLSSLFSLELGTALLITLLLASGSYIAVPAAARLAFPRAKEAIYLPLSLAIAFPFNVLIGVPLYYTILSKILG